MNKIYWLSRAALPCRLALLAAVLLVGGCAMAPRLAARVNGPHAPAIRRGVEFLVHSQNADGSWGTGTVSCGNETECMVPGSHDAFRVATTALCVMALRQAGCDQPRARGLEYLLQHGEARRDDGMLLYNTWAHIYALQALALEMRYSQDPRLAAAARWHLERLERYATYVGGWNYYDFQVGAQSPAMEPTSFSTAAGLVALYEARRSGLDVPQRLIDLAVHRLHDCRQPNGVYMYSSGMRFNPRTPGNQPPGAIGRTQPANYALWLWDTNGIAEPQAREGLALFFRYHHAINMGRKRLIPHESWYQTSGYYYYFDHYYAARLIERLHDAALFEQLAQVVAPLQERDGSWWDFAMWDYQKPYGTALAVLTLLTCDGSMADPGAAEGLGTADLKHADATPRR